MSRVVDELYDRLDHRKFKDEIDHEDKQILNLEWHEK
jgi:hypothetical protein